MRTKNIARHADVDAWDITHVDPLMLTPVKQAEFKLKSGGVVVLPWIVRLNSSPQLGMWLNSHCEGWYAHLKTLRAKRRKIPANYFFEFERDAIHAKNFHGGG